MRFRGSLFGRRGPSVDRGGALSAQATVHSAAPAPSRLKGFISATAVRPGPELHFRQRAERRVCRPGPNCVVDCWFGGGDVRNTRLTLVFDGPRLFGRLEGRRHRGDGLLRRIRQHDQQRLRRRAARPRALRLGYVQLSNGSTTIQLGQQWSPLFGNTAVSLSHIAFPLGYGSAGDIGWRFPGIFSGPEADAQGLGRQRGHSGRGDVRLVERPELRHDEQLRQLADGRQRVLAAVRAALQPGRKLGDRGPGAPTSSATSTRRTSRGPALRLRRPPNPCGPGVTDDKLTGSAVEIGAKFQIGPVLIQGNGYTGHSIGNSSA